MRCEGEGEESVGQDVKMGVKLGCGGDDRQSKD